MRTFKRVIPSLSLLVGSRRLKELSIDIEGSIILLRPRSHVFEQQRTGLKLNYASCEYRSP